MSYTVLARKYRPQSFADLVGQEHVTRALSNAIASNRVAHAFLFTGVRGVGKTTSARIMAKALNCERGPTAEPCNVCDACVQITQGNDLDVLEIDGASNNSVDDVRRLQESIPFRPARGRFKIVIVDEVHMLSTGAFNAFLKTLEEPPAHVKFIFATTESHKVPVTIRSRCQRYDFRLIPQSVIIERVRQILAAEKIEADDAALTIVAREAAGSMRDALTLLDQVVAFSGDKLLGREVSEKLGIADREHLHQLAAAVLTGDGKSALEVVERVATQGLDILHFTRQWLDLMRDVVVLQVAGDQPKLVELSAEERKRAVELGALAPLLELQRIFAGVAKLVDEVGKASAPRTLLEMGAVRLATRPKLVDLATLIARVEELGRSGSTAGSAGNRASPAGGGGPAPRTGGQPPQREGTTRDGAAPAREAPSPAAPRPAPPSAAPGGTPQRPAAPGAGDNPFQRFVPPESREIASRTEPEREAPSALTRPTPTAASPLALSNPAPTAASTLAPTAASSLAPSALGVSSAQAVAVAIAQPTPLKAASEAAPVPEAAGSAGADLQLWSAIVERLRTLEPRWAAMYEHGVPHEVSPQRVTVVFPEGSFFGRQAQTPAGTDALRRAVAEVLPKPAEVLIRLASEVRGRSLAQKEAAALDERKEGIKKRALNHPRVLEALKVFPELAQKQEIQVD